MFCGLQCESVLCLAPVSVCVSSLVSLHSVQSPKQAQTVQVDCISEHTITMSVCDNNVSM